MKIMWNVKLNCSIGVERKRDTPSTMVGKGQIHGAEDATLNDRLGSIAFRC